MSNNFFQINFCVKPYVIREPRSLGTQVIVGSMNMGYISDTARNRTHKLFRPKREPIPLGHSDRRLSRECRATFHSCVRVMLDCIKQSCQKVGWDIRDRIAAGLSRD